MAELYEPSITQKLDLNGTLLISWFFFNPVNGFNPMIVSKLY